MSKLASKAKSSKLKESLDQKTTTEPKERLVRQVKHKEYPRSYRLDPEIMNTLKSTLDKINDISPKKGERSKVS